MGRAIFNQVALGHQPRSASCPILHSVEGEGRDRLSLAKHVTPTTRYTFTSHLDTYQHISGGKKKRMQKGYCYL